MSLSESSPNSPGTTASSAPAPPSLDATDKRLLDLMQSAFPVTPQPWQALGEQLDLAGSEILQRVINLKRQEIIRQISPIFDTRALGYRGSLVAARVNENRVDEAAEVVNQHPGVSHNYLREAYFNLWFTLAVPPGEEIEDHLARLARDADFEDYLSLPTIKLFRIGVQLRMSDDDVEEKEASPAKQAPKQAPKQTPAQQSHGKKPVRLTEEDKNIIRITQDDLPLVQRPFDPMCEQLGMDFDQLRAWFENMQQHGVLRRFAAILKHRSAGFSANGMVVWQIDDEHIEQAGRIAADFPPVSHCYQRPTSEKWPYSLYTMIHARSREQCSEIIEQIKEQLTPLGVGDYRTLYSTHEFKKQRVRYFV